MLLVQEDVNQKTVAISVKATKLTSRLLAKAIAAALRKMRQARDSPHGKQTVKQLAQQNAGMQSICRFVCDCSGAVLGVIASLLFTMALLALILLREPRGALTTAAAAFLLSPYGIPKLAEWFIDRLDDLNGAMKSI